METKTCTKCNTEKPLNAFWNDGRSGDGKRDECMACRIPDTQICTKCNVEKPLNAFGVDKRFESGKRKECKLCRTAERQIYVKWYRWRDFKSACKKNGKELGITQEEFLSFWQEDCTYCGTPTPTSNLDRLDNSRGYFMDNIVPCCVPCNKAKNTMDKDEYLTHCMKVLRFNNLI